MADVDSSSDYEPLVLNADDKRALVALLKETLDHAHLPLELRLDLLNSIRLKLETDLSAGPPEIPQSPRDVIIQNAHELGILRLYHYQPFKKEWLKQIVLDRKIHLSTPANFNDPWDCRPHFFIRDDARIITIDHQRSSSRISSVLPVH